jgi:MFS family permease
LPYVRRKKLRSRKRKPNHEDEGDYLYHLHYNSRSILLFRLLIIALNIPVFGLLLTFADLLTSIGMSKPLCMTAVEASNFNTVLWGSAMIGRAISAATLVCIPMFTQLLLCSVALVTMGVVLVACPPGNALALWFGTAGVGLFATPAMPGFIAWSGDYAPITPFFMNLSLCAAGVGEMLFPFIGGQVIYFNLRSWQCVRMSHCGCARARVCECVCVWVSMRACVSVHVEQHKPMNVHII